MSYHNNNSDNMHVYDNYIKNNILVKNITLVLVVDIETMHSSWMEIYQVFYW